MRHANIGRQLSRNTGHRHALLRNLAAALLRHESIRTTLPKAKELRRVVEPLITLAREDTVAKRRLAFARLRDEEAVAKLFTDLGPHYKARPGGYTRILKHGFRPGDSAPMALMQLVDREAQITALAERHAEVRRAKAEAAEQAAEKPVKAVKPKQARPEKPAKAEKAEAKKTRKTAKGEKAADAKADKKTAKKTEKKSLFRKTAKKQDD